MKVNEIEVKEPVTIRKQKISVSYTLKAFGQNVNRLSQAKMLTTEEQEELNNLKKRLIERWIGQEMNL